MGIDNIWHVFPVDDTHDHILETEWRTIEIAGFDIFGELNHCVERRLLTLCQCGATVREEEGGGIIVIHNSFDGREGLEWVDEILNNE